MTSWKALLWTRALAAQVGWTKTKSQQSKIMTWAVVDDSVRDFHPRLSKSGPQFQRGVLPSLATTFAAMWPLNAGPFALEYHSECLQYWPFRMEHENWSSGVTINVRSIRVANGVESLGASRLLTAAWWAASRCLSQYWVDSRRVDNQMIKKKCSSKIVISCTCTYMMPFVWKYSRIDTMLHR
jgi:hypothetical protein